MPINPSSFLTFLARHYRPIEALCRQRARFASDDEVAAFLQSYMDTPDTSPARLISGMKEVGVLIPGTEDWSPPGFLARFLDELQNRHTLASPQVIQGWIAKLTDLVTRLDNTLRPATIGLEGLDLDFLNYLLGEIDQTFRAIADTVHGNCDRIASEVAAYRTIEDAQHLRRRLKRLMSLHTEFLEPVIRIIDITGDFYAVTEWVANRRRIRRIKTNIDLELCGTQRHPVRVMGGIPRRQQKPVATTPRVQGLLVPILPSHASNCLLWPGSRLPGLSLGPARPASRLYPHFPCRHGRVFVRSKTCDSRTRGCYAHSAL